MFRPWIAIISRVGTLVPEILIDTAAWFATAESPLLVHQAGRGDEVRRLTDWDGETDLEDGTDRLARINPSRSQVMAIRQE